MVRRITRRKPAEHKDGSEARARLREDFVAALAADYAQYGAAAIAALRIERPHEYVKLMASMLPKESAASAEEEENAPVPIALEVHFIRLKADFPEKLQCLFRPARYKILHGGRGGAKSWGIARALLILGREKPLRIACGREIQRSISDSVHQLLKTQVEQLGFGDFYRVQEGQIKGANGTLISFHGLKTNLGSLKSIEGIDIFWAEEAQSISKTSWDILIPTIRKDGSEIWVSFNPELETDETYRRFVASPPSGAIVQKIGWRDNPWFNDVLRQEMEDCRARSEDDYLHIWEGQIRHVLDGAVFAEEMRRAASEERFCRVPYDESKPVETFWDLGRADCTSIWFAQSVGFEFRLIDFLEDQGKALPFYLKALRERPYLYGDVWLPHDAKSKDTSSSSDRRFPRTDEFDYLNRPRVYPASHPYGIGGPPPVSSGRHSPVREEAGPPPSSLVRQPFSSSSSSLDSRQASSQPRRATGERANSTGRVGTLPARQDITAGAPAQLSAEAVDALNAALATGRATEADLLRIAREHNVRLVGGSLRQKMDARAAGDTRPGFVAGQPNTQSNPAPPSEAFFYANPGRREPPGLARRIDTGIAGREVEVGIDGREYPAGHFESVSALQRWRDDFDRFTRHTIGERPGEVGTLQSLGYAIPDAMGAPEDIKEFWSGVGASVDGMSAAHALRPGSDARPYSPRPASSYRAWQAARNVPEAQQRGRDAAYEWGTARSSIGATPYEPRPNYSGDGISRQQVRSLPAPGRTEPVKPIPVPPRGRTSLQPPPRILTPTAAPELSSWRDIRLAGESGLMGVQARKWKSSPAPTGIQPEAYQSASWLDRQTRPQFWDDHFLNLVYDIPKKEAGAAGRLLVSSTGLNPTADMIFQRNIWPRLIQAAVNGRMSGPEISSMLQTMPQFDARLSSSATQRDLGWIFGEARDLIWNIAKQFPHEIPRLLELEQRSIPEEFLNHPPPLSDGWLPPTGE